MYKNDFVVVVKHQGKVLREINDVVSLPYGSEYTILLKNHSNKKAVVNIYIDGDDVLDGKSIIVFDNSSMELKGFMKNNSVTNSFKFIERTEKISNYKGNKAEDSLVRVVYRFEAESPKMDWAYIYPGEPRSNLKSSWSSTPLFSTNSQFHNTVSYSCNCNLKIPDIGITVKGHPTSQEFIEGHVNTLESKSYSITLKLSGYKKNSVLINKAVSTRERITCNTCGTKSRTHVKYCRECGTYLH